MPDFPPFSVAFITGAGSGMGLAVAQRLVLDGITSIALVDIAESSLTNTRASLSNLNPDCKILTLGVDVSVEDQVNTAVELTVRTFGRLDICFNAAGISGPQGGIVDQSLEGMEKVLSINLRGVWLCERAQVRQMMEQEMRAVSTGLPLHTRGSIVNVGSLTSHLAIPELNPYIMAKHGVLGLTKADANDYAVHGIRVNCICPGWIRTAMTKVMTDNASMTEERATRTPMERWGLPEEVAYMASFLLSDKASFITGGSHHVDGGYHIR